MKKAKAQGFILKPGKQSDSDRLKNYELMVSCHNGDHKKLQSAVVMNMRKSAAQYKDLCQRGETPLNEEEK